jgi:N-acetylmuramoyl-L-alanine amidase
LTLLLVGCSSAPIPSEESAEVKYLYEIPPEFRDEEFRLKIIGDYAEYLAPVKFFIDPGHGGEDRFGASPGKKVVEADVNLRVALQLKSFLEESGSDVIISRDSDRTVDLDSRSQLANSSGADIFISIHHNAPGGSNRNWVNYTSTYYHATEEDYEYEPFEHDLARFIQRDLSYAMGNPGGLGSFDGTYSDYWIYPGAGFSVLRKTDIPAVLVECSFFTNLMEEERLQIEEFNRIQAWGIFKGVGKFFMNGYPTIELLENKSFVRDSTVNLKFAVKDTIDILPGSIIVYIDSLQHGFSYNISEDVITVEIEEYEVGVHTVRVIAMNENKSYSFPFERRFFIGEGYIEFRR